MKKNKLFKKRIKKDKKIGKKIFKGLVDTLPVPDIVKNQIDDKLNITEKNNSELEQRVTKLESDVERIINILTKMSKK